MAATQELVTIQLSPHAAALLRQAQEQRGFASPSEVVEDALRDWSDDQPTQGSDDLRLICRSAIEDDRPGVEPGPVFARLERKFQTPVDAAAVHLK